MLKIDNTVLVLVDFQGKLARIVQDSEQVIASACKLARAADVLELPIIWTEQNPAGLGPTVKELAGLLPGEPIAKQAFSCWREPAFAKALEGTARRSVLLAGIEAHICVFQTAADLCEAGFDVHVVAEAVSSRSASNCRIGLARCASAGATITSIESALFELLEAAGANCPAGAGKFKEILKLVK
jgi:nicotinamidase-related amidase